MMKRRSLLVGGAVAVVALGGGAAWYGRNLLPGAHTAESDAADYAKLLADVRDDYINGRVVEHEGWVLSQHEFDTIGSRAGKSASSAVS